ncbi:hypothetical protein T552_00104 [Pneumocystis carinii B80]|uniref:Uncharacterized protein n=1 Tax=Pneumocystis carinii (strain B80) TaxID=1408658 RepID=A0A0W4ZSY1_PNEC8|nr:hypothetical protein T552_00104 [Pneumocystis carinii B80]KTW31462.1 hypothetical protein T552_00104 [Pneumocystis carinii B80]
METHAKCLSLQRGEKSTLDDIPFLNFTGSKILELSKKQNLSNFSLSNSKSNKNINYQPSESYIKKKDANSLKKEQLFMSSLLNTDILWKTTNKSLENDIHDLLKKESNQIPQISIKKQFINNSNYFSKFNRHINMSEDMLCNTSDLYENKALFSKSNSENDCFIPHSIELQSSPSYLQKNSILYSYKNEGLENIQVPRLWNELSELKFRVKKLEIANKWKKSSNFNDIETSSLNENILFNNSTLNETEVEAPYRILYASLEKMKSNGISKELWAPLEQIINEILSFKNIKNEKTEEKVENILRSLTELSLAIYDYHQDITELSYSSEKKKQLNYSLKRSNSEHIIRPLNQGSSIFIKQYQKNMKPFQTSKTIENDRNLLNSRSFSNFNSYLKYHYNNDKYKDNIYSTHSRPKIFNTTTNFKTPITNGESINFKNISTPEAISESSFINNSKYR